LRTADLPENQLALMYDKTMDTKTFAGFPIFFPDLLPFIIFMLLDSVKKRDTLRSNVRRFL